MKIQISAIRTDGGTQPRGAINFDAVFEYMDSMQCGATFPPVTVFYDGSNYWLADGFHRVEATFSAGSSEIECDVHQGTQQDAQWYSFGANKSNGLFRSNEDKQRAVKAALMHPLGASLSDSAIAKHVGVSHPTVSAWREKLESSCKLFKIAERSVTRNGTTYQQNTSAIGRSQKQTAVFITPLPQREVVASVSIPLLPPAGPAVSQQYARCFDGVLSACRQIADIGITTQLLAEYANSRPDRDQFYELVEAGNEFLNQLLGWSKEPTGDPYDFAG